MGYKSFPVGMCRQGWSETWLKFRDCFVFAPKQSRPGESMEGGAQRGGVEAPLSLSTFQRANKLTIHKFPVECAEAPSPRHRRSHWESEVDWISCRSAPTGKFQSYVHQDKDAKYAACGMVSVRISERKWGQGSVFRRPTYKRAGWIVLREWLLPLSVLG